jgi:hypothetical protein
MRQRHDRSRREYEYAGPDADHSVVLILML